MEVIIVKMPLSDFTKFPDMSKNWQVMEQWEETEEIIKMGLDVDLLKQELRDKQKEYFNLKHPKIRAKAPMK